jgi:hypothetical protein
MSRSYKKSPGYYDRNPFFKAKANEKIRHYKDLPNGMAYKKLSESWDIHDYKRHVWRRSDLISWEDRIGLQKKWPCFKELCKTKMYRESRVK